MEFSEDEKQLQERAATYIDDHRDEFILFSGSNTPRLAAGIYWET